MEYLRIGEARGHPYAFNDRRTKDSQRRVLRLPTPEESQSSTETLERLSASDTSRRDLPDRDQAFRASSNKFSAIGNIDSSLPHRRSASTPDSPPYGQYDVQRPSLPPLKTLLGDSLSSPPQTPTSHGASGQLSPREPTVTAATYKPPSLYPNKKQRIHSGYEPSLSTHPTSTVSSPGLPSAIYLSRGPNASQLPPCTYGSAADLRQTRRMSVRYPSGRSSPDRELDPRSTASYSGNNITDVPHNRVSRSLDRRSQSLSRPSVGVSESSGRYVHHISPPYERKPSADFLGPYGRDYASDVHHHARNASYQHCERKDQSPVDYSQVQHVKTILGRQRIGHLQDAHGAISTPYDVSDAPFFMPSPYEYHHGKARKRSNLPKQSTEIMKTWFDQNIVNPYPSEEQKALFSVATGISLTQVSNWFINHRRRCPELRDKREKGRGTGGDD